MGPNGAEQVSRMMTTGELFQVFGVSPALGRNFTKEEMQPRGSPVVILGHGFWQRWFGGDPGGARTATRGSGRIAHHRRGWSRGLSNRSDRARSLYASGIDPANPAATGSRAFQSYGRLAAETTLEAAQAEMSVIAAALRQQERVDEGMDVFVFGLQDFLVRDARPSLQLLMAVVATVLAIGCVNLAGCCWPAASSGGASSPCARHSGRAAAGSFDSWSWRVSCCPRWRPCGSGARSLGDPGPRVAHSRGADGGHPGRSAWMRRACLHASGVDRDGAGVRPGAARQASHVNPELALRERARGAGRSASSPDQNVLVVTEVALAVVLLIGAGLFLRTLSSLVRVDLGFRPDGTITMGCSSVCGRPRRESRPSIGFSIASRAVPGVKAAGTIQFLPLRGTNCGTAFWMEEQAATRDSSRTQPTECSLVSRGYFAAMGIPILVGRPSIDGIASPLLASSSSTGHR